MTQNISNSFKVINLKKEQVKSLSELYVLSGREYISVDKFDIATKTQTFAGGVAITESREIKSVEDLKRNMTKLCLKDDSGFYVEKFSNPTIYHKGFVVPSTYESISIDKTGATDSEKIPYGLKRTLTTEAQEPSRDENAYLYVQIGDEWTFVRQGNVFYYDGAEKKTYLDALNEGKDISSLQFFDVYDKPILSVYTEYEYKFSKLVKKEHLDLKEGTMSVISVDDDGKETIEKTEKINKSYSEQSFEKFEVDDEKKPGKKKTVSKIKSINYASVKVDESNKNDSKWYISVTVKDAIGSHAMMVKLSDLVDEDGNVIYNLSQMLGKKVKIKKGDLVVATSEPLTFEQANLRYDTVKTYQEVEGKPTKDTCLRLANGNYVKELESVQPMAYKVASSTEVNFNKYLVQQTRADGSKIYVVVDKDYFEKHSSSNGLDATTSRKLVACSYTDANCDIVQTTSKDEDIEQCSIVRKIPGIDAEVQNKGDSFSAFKNAYAEGKYFVSSVYVDGVAQEVEKGRRRYEYTDVLYTSDYAEDLFQYRSMSTQNTKFENGKIKGGAKFNVQKGIIKSYEAWAKALAVGVTILPVSAIFIPVLAPIVAVYGVSLLASAPLIPIVNLGIGLVKNGNISRALSRVTKFKDKTQYNRKHQVKDITKEINALFKIQNDLNPTQFEDEYSRLMNKILMLSATTSNNAFVIENGVAEVNSNNANIANEYIWKYNSNQRKLDAVSKKIEKLKAKGKPIPEKLQAQFDDLSNKQQLLKNAKIGNSYSEDSKIEQLRTDAAALKFYYYVSTLKGDELNEFLNNVGLTESFKESRISYDAKVGLKLDNVSVYASEKQIKKAFEDDGATIEAWKNVKDMIVSSFDKVVEPKKNPPINVGVENIISSLNDLENIYSELSEELNFSIDLEDEYQIKQFYINNQQSLKDTIDNIYSSAKNLTSAEAVRAKVIELTSKREWITGLKNKVNNTVTAIESIERLAESCNSILENINIELEAIPESLKNKFKSEFEMLNESVKRSQQIVKGSRNVDKIQAQENATQVNIDKANKLLKLIKDAKVSLEKNTLINNISDYHKHATEKIESLNSTSVKTKLSAFMMILESNKDTIKRHENQARLKETSREQVLELSTRSQFIYNLIDVGVKSMFVLEDYSKENTQVNSKSEIGNLIIQMAELIQVVETDTIDSLRLKLAKAQTKYENEILSYKSKVKVVNKPPEKKEKKSEPKLFDAKINSEDRLVVLLTANSNSKDRKNLVTYIKEQSGVEISEEDIIATVKAIDRRHKANKNARAGAHKYSNQNIAIILDYGQKFLTEHAVEVKEHIVRDL